MIDIVHKDVAMDVSDVVSDVCEDATPELLGRLVHVLVKKGVLGAADLQYILPLGYYVRDDK